MLGAFNTGQTISEAATDSATGLAVAAFAGGPVGAIVGGAIFAGQLISSLVDQNGPKKLDATTYANNAMYAAQVNLAEWNNYPANMKTKSLQIQYLNNFQQIWGYLAEGCSNPRLGSAGQRCISERDHGGIYDYWKSFYDPIVNDPQVYDPTSLPATLTTGSTTIFPNTIVNPITGTSFLTYVEANPLIDIAVIGGLALLLL